MEKIAENKVNPRCPICNNYLMLQYGLIPTEDIWQCCSCGFQCLANMNLEAI